MVQKPLTDLGVHILRAPLPQQPQDLRWEKLPEYFRGAIGVSYV